jgi:hypothetical protein
MVAAAAPKGDYPGSVLAVSGNEKRELVNKLMGYPTFKGCNEGDIKALVDAGGPFTLPAGWPMVEQGIPADAIYVLTSGEARVFYVREQVATLGPGDIAERTSGLRVENPAMMDVFAKHPAVREAFKAAYEAHQASS